MLDLRWRKKSIGSWRWFIQKWLHGVVWHSILQQLKNNDFVMNVREVCKCRQSQNYLIFLNYFFAHYSSLGGRKNNNSQCLIFNDQCDVKGHGMVKKKENFHVAHFHIQSFTELRWKEILSTTDIKFSNDTAEVRVVFDWLALMGCKLRRISQWGGKNNSVS